uniref:1-phosphofructokinase family hexose kinase n=1 Tax=Candidatus Enterococcus willemsii TaxID=1857215 RepID=UPI00403F9D4E
MIHLICPNPAIDRTILLEKIETATPNRPIEVKEFPGGKSFNVAYALSYEETPELMIHTMVGGIYGEHLIQLANEQGYQVQATTVRKNTRLCNILVDTTKKEIIPVYEGGFDLDTDTLELFTNNLLATVKENDLLVFSGSLMKGMPTNYISQIEQALKQRHIEIKLCVDTSGEALVSTYNTTSPYLIKINDEEIQDLFPEKNLQTIDDYLSLLTNDIKSEIPNFIITLGKKGIVGRIDGTLYTGAAQPVEAKNPIACGDFFLGRLVKGIAQQQAPEDTLKSALLFSTCNAMNWFPAVTKEQMEQLRPTITVNKK